MTWWKDLYIFFYCYALLSADQPLMSSLLVGFYLFLNSRFDKLKYDGANKTLEVEDDK